MGDPQAPLEKVLQVLDAHGLLGEEGRVRGDVALYSMGDHFDWGGAAEADAARDDGLALLAWLSAHAADHVHLLLGNHDLARVGELADFDDADFAAAQAIALDAYARKDDAVERALLARYPALPSAEVAARDFASFSVAQRELVVRALEAKRFRLAFASSGAVLLTHAGITLDDLAGIGAAEAADARAMAAALNGRLDGAFAAWAKGPLSIPGLHEPGDAAHGEGEGSLYHRPTSERITPANAPRRFDPRRLPLALTQVIGHIADEKCRTLMAEWVEPAKKAVQGELRTLVTDGARVVYAAGVRETEPTEARILFTDGAMRRAAVASYALLDLGTMKPLPPSSESAATMERGRRGSPTLAGHRAAPAPARLSVRIHSQRSPLNLHRRRRDGRGSVERPLPRHMAC